MNENPSVNRYLDDKALDHVDHALGRPMWPLRESYRNYFATSAESANGKAFEASPHWETGACDGRLTYYHVTEAGRQALDDYLTTTGQASRFTVSYLGHPDTIAAATPAKARYEYFIRLHEVLPDLTFIKFARRARGAEGGVVSKHSFTKEADLCAAFIETLPDGWTAYPETGGFDILLVRAADGAQIGVEAKLKLNAKVICQVAEDAGQYNVARPGPDYRAVLIPDGVSLELSPLLPLLGITCLTMREIERGPDGKPVWFSIRGYVKIKGGGYASPCFPELPTLRPYGDHGWQEFCPAKRIAVPDYVPDVGAGHSAPVALTPWKIAAIKLVITLRRRGFVTRQDFAHFGVSMSRWTQEHWLMKDGNGGWIAGPNIPDFKAQHPVNFGQIEADFEKWKAPDAATQRGLFVEPPVGAN